MGGYLCGMEQIQAYFPELSAGQIERYRQLDALYREWNARINVISRKDIDHLYEHHVLHSLAITRVLTLVPGSRVLDLGTGGGFPGVPLAIYYPEVHFTCIDGTLKKITVVKEVCSALGLENVTALQARAEEWKGEKFDCVVSRAVASLDKLEAWCRPLISQKQRNPYPNGLWVLKGGEVHKELKLLSRGAYYEVFPLGEWFEEEWFEEKYLIYVQW